MARSKGAQRAESGKQAHEAQEREAVLVYYTSPRFESELKALATDWKKTRQQTSSSALKWAMHPSYQRIIGKGQAAIPFILQELQREPDHWFWALHAITGHDPVPEGDQGDIAAMARAWIAWGKQRGYIH